MSDHVVESKKHVMSRRTNRCRFITLPTHQDERLHRRHTPTLFGCGHVKIATKTHIIILLGVYLLNWDSHMTSLLLASIFDHHDSLLTHFYTV